MGESLEFPVEDFRGGLQIEGRRQDIPGRRNSMWKGRKGEGEPEFRIRLTVGCGWNTSCEVEEDLR